MNETLFRTLLLQSEGPEVDFKRDQYAFIGADDLAKSKLLKDILTFANSWRLGDAHILIGVEDIGSGNRDPRGIPSGDYIDDASLQQFVNSKTHREVKFSYQAFCTTERVLASSPFPSRDALFRKSEARTGVFSAPYQMM